MSVFLDWNHLFLRNPHGGVEDVNSMKAAGFNAIFLNVADYPLEEWDIVRRNAANAAVVCGPWARCAEHGSGAFDAERLESLLQIAKQWGSPVIVNCEAELKGSGKSLTSYIDAECEGYDWALSMEPWPFSDVDWSPISAPVLPQCFGPDWGRDTSEVISEWQRCGVQCVVPTYGTYAWAGQPAQPGWYQRKFPYGLYTADDCGNNFQPWAALGSHNPCAGDVPVPPTNGGDMEKIGSQHGVTAAMNRLRDLDPGGTALQKAGDKWPPLSTLDGTDMGTWKAYDKLERTLSILVHDHDQEVGNA